MKNGFHSSLHIYVGLNRIKIKLEKEFSVDFIDTTDQADPQLLKKLKKMERDKG